MATVIVFTGWACVTAGLAAAFLLHDFAVTALLITGGVAMAAAGALLHTVRQFADDMRLAAEELLGAVKEEGLRTRGVIRDKNHQP